MKNPPKNNSKETIKELEKLHKKEKKRAKERENKINEEKFYKNLFKSWPMITKEDIKLITYFTENILNPIIIKLKMKYNRVRPSYLDKSLNPSINIPKHPSYPSGHAIQVYTAALLSGKKYPEYNDVYIKKANDIAVNREHAGVHYSSDTKYGEEIARKLVTIIDNPIL